MRHQRFSMATAIWIGAALVATAPAMADVPDVPDHYRFYIGGVFAVAYTDGGLGSADAGVAAGINFEDTFDMPESRDIVHAEFNWRINKGRHFIDVGYMGLNRDGTNTLEEDLEWGDFVYLANSEVTGRFKSTFPYAAWRYAFLDLPQVRISGSAGIDYLMLEAGVEARGGVTDPNGVPVSGAVEEEVSLSAPVPQLGLQLDWALSKHLSVLMYLRQIYVNVAGIDGGVGQSTARLNWWFSRHAGVAIGLDKQSIDLKSFETGSTQARFRYELRGFSLYLNLGF